MNVKICGLSEPDTLNAAINAGARYVGFVFFPKSPRNVSPAQAASLGALVPPGVCKVALTVDASDDALEAILNTAPIDMIQLHGAETPERVAEVKARFGLPVMKAIGIAGSEDLAKIATYARVADQLLVDTKPPKDSDRPGGNGEAFDWSLIAGHRWALPWMLAGGLTHTNVAAAIAQTGATQIDLSSAVETAPGIKDADLIKSFIQAALA